MEALSIAAVNFSVERPPTANSTHASAGVLLYTNMKRTKIRTKPSNFYNFIYLNQRFKGSIWWVISKAGSAELYAARLSRSVRECLDGSVSIITFLVVLRKRLRGFCGG